MNKMLQIKSLVFLLMVSFSFNQSTWIAGSVGEYENGDCTGDIQVYPEEFYSCMFQFTLNDDGSGYQSNCDSIEVSIDSYLTWEIDTLGTLHITDSVCEGDDESCEEYMTEEECPENCNWDVEIIMLDSIDDGNYSTNYIDEAECDDDMYDNQQDCENNDLEWHDESCTYFEITEGVLDCSNCSFDDESCESDEDCEDGEWCEDGECVGGDGAPECLWDCEGIEGVDPDDDANEFCDWFLEAHETNCQSDCDEETLVILEGMYTVCNMCATDDSLDCNDYFNEEDCDTDDDCDDGDICEDSECVSDDDDGPPECMLDCEGIYDVDPDADADSFCSWLIGLDGGDCLMDCDTDTMDDIIDAMISCETCLEDDDYDCADALDNSCESDDDCDDGESCEDGECVSDDNDGPPTCIEDCTDFDLVDGDTDLSSDESCTIISSWGDDECLNDCQGEDLEMINMFVFMCTECLENDNCEEIFDGCESDEDCEDGEWCDEGECIDDGNNNGGDFGDPCVDTDDCNEDLVCNWYNDEYYACIECEFDSECEVGEYCEDSECINDDIESESFSITSMILHPGGDCSADDGQAGFCMSDDTVTNEADCPIGICMDGSGNTEDNCPEGMWILGMCEDGMSENQEDCEQNGYFWSSFGWMDYASSFDITLTFYEDGTFAEDGDNAGTYTIYDDVLTLFFPSECYDHDLDEPIEGIESEEECDTLGGDWEEGDTATGTMYDNSIFLEMIDAYCEGDFGDQESCEANGEIWVEQCIEYVFDEIDGDGGPPECVWDCEGVFDVDPDGDLEEFCEWALALDGSCYDDCEGDDAMEIADMLAACEDLLDVDIVSLNKYSLSAPYPNPFNPTTTISYELEELDFINISIYDINGKLLSNIVNEMMPSGHHSIVWDASDYPSGIYFVKMISGNYNGTEKVLLVK